MSPTRPGICSNGLKTPWCFDVEVVGAGWTPEGFNKNMHHTNETAVEAEVFTDKMEDKALNNAPGNFI